MPFKTFIEKCKKCSKTWKGTWELNNKDRCCIHCGISYERGKKVEELENKEKVLALSEDLEEVISVDSPEVMDEDEIDEVIIDDVDDVDGTPPVTSPISKNSSNKNTKFGTDSTGRALTKSGKPRKERADKGKARK